MAVSWTIVPIPRWYFADNFGRPAGGAKLYTSDADNPQTPRAVASNPAGTTFYTNPILFDENGEAPGPFFWQFDDAGTDAGYFLRLTDADGNLLWTMNNFGPGIAGGGGGGVITTNLSLDNQITNGCFWNNIGTTATPIVNNTVLAPGAHEGFGGTVLSDIYFTRTGGSATDNISFQEFFPSEPFQASDDVTPIFYLNYTCTVNPLGESSKRIYIPITANVQNLSDSDVTLTFWGQNVSGATDITLSFVQNFGNGPSASATNIVGIGTYTLPASPTWQKFSQNVPVPDASAFTIGECKNSVLYLMIDLPINTLTNINMAKFCLYLGDQAPVGEFETLDKTSSMINTPRTGDVRLSYNTFAPYGWVFANDTTIGYTGSGATTTGTQTFPLYYLLYQNVSNTYAPVSGGRTGNAVDDFLAGKTMQLTKVLGRALASAGTPSTGGTAWSLGQFTGAETHTLSIAEMPAHNHTASTVAVDSSSGLGTSLAISVRAPTNATNLISVASQGGGAAHSIMQPTAFFNVFIKL